MATLIYNTAGDTGFDMRTVNFDSLIAGMQVNAFNPVILQWKNATTQATVSILGTDLNPTVSGGTLTELAGPTLRQVFVPNLEGTEFGLNLNGLTVSATAFWDIVQTKNWTRLAEFVRQDDDNIIGTKNNDTLEAMGGHDEMTGGKGADAFRFTSEPDGVDDWSVTIKDFRHGVDRLEFWGSLLNGANIPAGPMEAKYFHTGRAATTTEHSIIYNKARGLLYFDDDGAGGFDPILLARLGAGTVLTIEDLWVI